MGPGSGRVGRACWQPWLMDESGRHLALGWFLNEVCEPFLEEEYGAHGNRSL